jgi:hypothetical protein
MKDASELEALCLARIPEEILKSRAEYFERITQDQMNAVDNDLMKEQRTLTCQSILIGKVELPLVVDVKTNYLVITIYPH